MGSLVQSGSAENWSDIKSAQASMYSIAPFWDCSGQYLTSETALSRLNEFWQ
jgi:hypothetical protein